MAKEKSTVAVPAPAKKQQPAADPKARKRPTPVTYTVIATTEIPPADPNGSRRGYYASIVTDIVMLPEGSSLQMSFDDRESSDYFASQVRQAAKKLGVQLHVEVRNEGLTRYFRVADKKPVSWAAAALKQQPAGTATVAQGVVRN